MKWNFLWFPFYLNADSLFHDMFSSPTRIKPGYFAVVVADMGGGGREG